MLLHGEGDAGLNEVDDMGWTALMHAAEAGHLETVRWLLGKKARVLITNRSHSTAYGIACKCAPSLPPSKPQTHVRLVRRAAASEVKVRPDERRWRRRLTFSPNPLTLTQVCTGPPGGDFAEGQGGRGERAQVQTRDGQGQGGREEGYCCCCCCRERVAGAAALRGGRVRRGGEHGRRVVSVSERRRQGHCMADGRG